jgi:hypothetical protein
MCMYEQQAHTQQISLKMTAIKKEHKSALYVSPEGLQLLFGSLEGSGLHIHVLHTLGYHSVPQGWQAEGLSTRTYVKLDTNQRSSRYIVHRCVTCWSIAFRHKLPVRS